MSFSELILGVSQATNNVKREPANVIEFAESPDWGLGLSLFPVQKIILKAHYGLKLDDNSYGVSLDDPIPLDHPDYDIITDLDENSLDYLHYKNRVPITDWDRSNPRYMTEAGYLRFLYSEGRANIAEVDHERRELVLSIGRRSGKTYIAAIIAGYETYKLILKGNPQEYYGLPPGNNIQIISVATGKDQAGLLYQEVSSHFRNCGFFSPYTANNTQTYARFQTPKDVERYGRYVDDATAKATLKVTFMSCIAQGLRGAGNIVVILDEMAHFTEESGSSSAESVYKAVTPSMATFSHKDPKNYKRPIGDVEARIIAISSPLGKQGMFYKLFQQGMKGGRGSGNMLCIEAPTWEVNPTLPASAFESEYMKDATSFFTEFGGRFTDRTRGYLDRPQDLFDCIDPTHRPGQAIPARRPHFIAIDLALKGDATAVAIGHLESSERGPVIVLDLIDQMKAGEGKYENVDTLNFEEVADWIQRLSKKYFIAHGVIDQHAGIPFEQALAKRGLHQIQRTHFTDVINSEVYKNFKDMMWDKRLVLYDWPIEDGKEHCAYIEEMMELQEEKKSKYVIKVEAPNIEGKHDDRPDALVRMIWLASDHMTKPKLISGVRTGTHRGSAGGVQGSSRDNVRLAMQARRSGSSPDRQQSRSLRGHTRGR